MSNSTEEMTMKPTRPELQFVAAEGLKFQKHVHLKLPHSSRHSVLHCRNVIVLFTYTGWAKTYFRSVEGYKRWIEDHRMRKINVFRACAT